MQYNITFLVLILASVSLSLRTTTSIDMWGPVSAPLILNLDSPAPPSQSVFESTTFNTIIGNERDILIIAEEGSNSVVAFSQVNNERLSFAAPSQMKGSFLLQWDGPDNSPNRNSNGLNGINLAADGGDRFQFVIETDVEAEFQFRIYSGDSRMSSLTLNIERELGPITYTPLFSQFSGNADFSNVGAIELFTEFDGDLDFSIFKIEIATEESEVSPDSFSPISPVSFSPVSISPVSVSPVSVSPVSVSPVSVEPVSPISVERIEFVRPIRSHFIDFNHQCERVVKPDDDDNDNSSSDVLIPGSLMIFLISLFIL